jgi:hypothetical protein
MLWWVHKLQTKAYLLIGIKRVAISLETLLHFQISGGNVPFCLCKYPFRSAWCPPPHFANHMEKFPHLFNILFLLIILDILEEKRYKIKFITLLKLFWEISYTFHIGYLNKWEQYLAEFVYSMMMYLKHNTFLCETEKGGE